MRAMWLRKVETRPADFLAARFNYQLATRESAPEEDRPKTVMSRLFSNIHIFDQLAVTALLVAENTEVKAGVAISIEQDQDVWAGQQVTFKP